VRPYWKGYLKLALVSCPIALHAACSTAERIAFRQINKATGNRLRQQLVDEVTREPVAPEHKGRGYEVAKGQYLIIEDAELEAIEIESTHTIEIDSFVPRSQIDSASSTLLIMSCPASRSDKRPLQSFVRPCAARRWWRLGDWCCRSASG
jgi:Ku protein